MSAQAHSFSIRSVNPDPLLRLLGRSGRSVYSEPLEILLLIFFLGALIIRRGFWGHYIMLYL